MEHRVPVAVADAGLQAQHPDAVAAGSSVGVLASVLGSPGAGPADPRLGALPRRGRPALEVTIRALPQVLKAGAPVEVEPPARWPAAHARAVAAL